MKPWQCDLINLMTLDLSIMSNSPLMEKFRTSLTPTVIYLFPQMIYLLCLGGQHLFLKAVTLSRVLSVLFGCCNGLKWRCRTVNIKKSNLWICHPEFEQIRRLWKVLKVTITAVMQLYELVLMSLWQSFCSRRQVKFRLELSCTQNIPTMRMNRQYDTS